MSLPSLYELADEFQEALESLTDLDDQSVKDTLESLEGEFKLKTTNVAKYIKNLEHTAEGIKEVESRQHKRRTSIESKIKHLKEYLRYNLEKTNTQKIESSEITITIQNNPHKVVITNEGDNSPRTVVIEFQTFEEANLFYNSKEYQVAHSILKGYAVRHHQIVEGA